MTQYPKKHMAKMGDLFPDYENYDWLKGNGNIIKKYGKNKKSALARGIFNSFINLVMDDVVEGHVFKFPEYDAMFYIEHPTEFAIRELTNQGKLKDFNKVGIDSPALPAYRFKDARGEPHKYRVIMDKNRYRRMLRYLFEGKKYSHNIGIW